MLSLRNHFPVVCSSVCLSVTSLQKACHQATLVHKKLSCQHAASSNKPSQVWVTGCYNDSYGSNFPCFTDACITPSFVLPADVWISLVDLVLYCESLFVGCLDLYSVCNTITLPARLVTGQSVEWPEFVCMSDQRLSLERDLESLAAVPAEFLWQFQTLLLQFEQFIIMGAVR